MKVLEFRKKGETGGSALNSGSSNDELDLLKSDFGRLHIFMGDRHQELKLWLTNRKYQLVRILYYCMVGRTEGRTTHMVSWLVKLKILWWKLSGDHRLVEYDRLTRRLALIEDMLTLLRRQDVLKDRLLESLGNDVSFFDERHDGILFWS
ncbi:MAG: hypothetical protein M3Q07_00855 [Pseudobdellovibrionaceae bacterium]|nr:hypothetical protein [Pseudobdellovibrionaceae bacterium]